MPSMLSVSPGPTLLIEPRRPFGALLAPFLAPHSRRYLVPTPSIVAPAGLEEEEQPYHPDMGRMYDRNFVFGLFLTQFHHFRPFRTNLLYSRFLKSTHQLHERAPRAVLCAVCCVLCCAVLQNGADAVGLIGACSDAVPDSCMLGTPMHVCMQHPAVRHPDRARGSARRQRQPGVRCMHADVTVCRVCRA